MNSMDSVDNSSVNEKDLNNDLKNKFLTTFNDKLILSLTIVIAILIVTILLLLNDQLKNNVSNTTPDPSVSPYIVVNSSNNNSLSSSSITPLSYISDKLNAI